MARFTVTRRINAPVDVVFPIFIDFHNAATNVRAIKRCDVLTDGPTRVGTRFRETRIMFKKEATEELEVTQLETNSHVTVSGNSCGCRFDSTFRFKPDGDSASIVEMEMKTTPLTLFAKVMAPLGALMAGSMKKIIEEDFDDLQRVAESRAAETSAA